MSQKPQQANTSDVIKYTNKLFNPKPINVPSKKDLAAFGVKKKELH